MNPGDRLGPYQVLEPIGRGGMAVVYRARHVELGRIVALKVLGQSLSRDPEQIARFRREARLLSRLRHPGIVPVFTTHFEGGIHCFAMQLIPWPTLERHLESREMEGAQIRIDEAVTFVAALANVGVVAIDEKYILVPTARRTGRKMKMDRWMYLFLAIDPHSYDILHSEVYPDRNTEAARAFLLGLKGKGCLAPKVIVSDLWGPYETAIADVYPDARHHQCVFHAEQAVSTMMRKYFGLDFRSIPQVEEIRKSVVHLFRARSRRTLIRRYRRLISRKEAVVEAYPGLTPVFESLKTHFPKLANAYTSRRLSIPKTNNAVESVIRIFTRRYKTMTGFNSLETARGYVKLWSWYYRFRPFSPDARPHIRNRCPLKIAGYDIQGTALLACIMGPAPPE